MVYLSGKGRTGKAFSVFVQELLWFIIEEILAKPNGSQYSYKNCYGLS